MHYDQKILSEPPRVETNLDAPPSDQHRDHAGRNRVANFEREHRVLRQSADWFDPDSAGLVETLGPQSRYHEKWR